MERITITIDDELLATVDALVEKRGYPSRSEAIRELLRRAAKQEQAADGRAPCVATLTYVYDHSVRHLAHRTVATQHDHHDLNIATTHVHVDHDSCLEVIILRGRADAIEKLANTLTAQRGVRHANLHMIPTKPSGHRHSHPPAGPQHDHEAP
jgi:CopG family nickel-responsive transcriptional regulator